MAIVLDISSNTGSYDKLRSDIARWINRTDLGDDIPGFIVNAEARINTDLRVRQMLETATLDVVDGKSASLPDGWLEFKLVTAADGTPMKFMTPEDRQQRAPWASGDVRFFTPLGTRVQFLPEAGTAFTVESLFYKRLVPLATNGSNWLLLEKPNVYLYAALAEASLFLKKPDDANRWGGLYAGLVGAMNEESEKASHSGSSLRVRVR